MSDITNVIEPKEGRMHTLLLMLEIYCALNEIAARMGIVPVVTVSGFPREHFDDMDDYQDSFSTGHCLSDHPQRPAWVKRLNESVVVITEQPPKNWDGKT